VGSQNDRRADEAPPDNAGTPGADAFALAYARWYPSLVSYCRHVGCGDDSPEDVAQEAFMRAWTNWDPSAADRSIWPWLAVIAKRCCLDRWRRSARNVARAGNLERLPRRPPSTPEECLVEAEDRALATWAFMQLRPGERRILGLREIERWTYQDIADMENTSLEAVRSSLRRSRAKLRDAYHRAVGAMPVAVLGRRLWDRVGLAVARVRRALPLDIATFERAEVAVFSSAAVLFVAAALPSAGAGHAGQAGEVALNRPLAAPATVGTTSGTGRGAPAPVGANSAFSSQGTDSGTRAITHPAPPRGVVRPGLPTDSGTTPENTQFSTIAASANGQTIFAGGTQGNVLDCAQLVCPELFESTDSGTTWTRVLGLNYQGGALLVPPNYPADSRLFETGGRMMKMSLTDGSLFTPIAPFTGSAASTQATQRSLWEARTAGATGPTPGCSRRSTSPARPVTRPLPSPPDTPRTPGSSLAAPIPRWGRRRRPRSPCAPRAPAVRRQF
jgi:RNA polymerase sigma-70 factor (ECF subfamily)